MGGRIAAGGRSGRARGVDHAVVDLDGLLELDDSDLHVEHGEVQRA